MFRLMYEKKNEESTLSTYLFDSISRAKDVSMNKNVFTTLHNCIEFEAIHTAMRSVGKVNENEFRELKMKKLV